MRPIHVQWEAAHAMRCGLRRASGGSSGIEDIDERPAGSCWNGFAESRSQGQEVVVPDSIDDAPGSVAHVE